MKTFLFFLLAISAYGQQIDPRTQINWPRVSGTGSPVSAGFACGTNYGQPYTDTAGPHYWVCTPTGWFQVDGAGGNFTDFKQNGVALTGQFATNPQTFDMDDTTPAAEAGYLNGKFLTDSATGKVSIEFPATTQQFLMNVGADNNHVFVPFGSCSIPTNTGVVAYATCDATSAAAAEYKGGIFGYNATVIFNWTGAVLPSWLPAGDVTSVDVVAYTNGYINGSATSGCSGGTCTGFLYPPFNGQVTSPVSGVTGATIGSLVVNARLDNGPFCGSCPSPFTIHNALQITQIGLLVGFTGVTKPSSTALNIKWPLEYFSDDNSLGVSLYYPNTFTPVLTSQLPGPQNLIPDGTVYWTSDNTQTTIGANCTGSGTAGSAIAMCVASTGLFKLVQTFGAGFGVATVSNSDGSLTISPTSGNVVASINTSHVNAWGARQTFNSGFDVVNHSINITGANAPMQSNGNAGILGQVWTSQGPGLTPIWAAGGGGGSIPTTTYMLAGDGSGGAVATAMDDGHTTASTITSTEPIAVAASSLPTQIDMAYNPGHTPSPAALTASFAPDSSGNGTLSENNAPYSRLCTAANSSSVPGCGSGNPSHTPTNSVQIADGSGGFISDSNITIDPSIHTLNVGTVNLGNPYFTFTNLSAIGTSWTLDYTSPATAALSIGGGTAGASKYIDGGTGNWTTLPTPSNIPLSNLATQAADTVVMNATGSTAAPTAVAMPTCTSGADLYNTTTHTWSCVSSAASGLVPLGTYTGTTTSSLSMLTRNATGQSGNLFQSDFDLYEVDIVSTTFTAALNPGFQFSTNGTSCDTGANYEWQEFQGFGSTTNSGKGTSAVAMLLSDSNVTMATGAVWSGTYTVYNPLDSTNNKFMGGTSYTRLSTPNTIIKNNEGYYASATAVVGMCFVTNTSTFASVTVHVYGKAH